MSGSRKDTRRIRDKTLQVNMWPTCQKLREKHQGDQTLVAKEIRTRGAVEEALEFYLECTLGNNQRICLNENYFQRYGKGLTLSQKGNLDSIRT